MAYTLTLSTEERQAIDWVGGRDWNGHDLRNLLWLHCKTLEDAGWDDRVDLTFIVPEHVAWQIHDHYEASGGIPHFAPGLSNKLLRFLEGIV